MPFMHYNAGRNQEAGELHYINIHSLLQRISIKLNLHNNFNSIHRSLSSVVNENSRYETTTCKGRKHTYSVCQDSITPC
jgi:hypothetical protein